MGKASCTDLIDTFRANSINFAGLQEAQYLDTAVCKRLFEAKGWECLFSTKVSERNTQGRAATCFNKGWASRQKIGIFKTCLRGDILVVGIWSRLTCASVYLPAYKHKNTVSDYECVLDETRQAIEQYKAARPLCCKNVVLLCDANVELRPGVEGITGGGVKGGTSKEEKGSFEKERAEGQESMRGALVSFARHFKLRFANTFAEWDPTYRIRREVEGGANSGLREEENDTRRKRRRKAKGSGPIQKALDYIAVPQEWSSQLSFEARWICLRDSVPTSDPRLESRREQALSDHKLLRMSIPVHAEEETRQEMRRREECHVLEVKG